MRKLNARSKKPIGNMTKEELVKELIQLRRDIGITGEYSNATQIATPQQITDRMIAYFAQEDERAGLGPGMGYYTITGFAQAVGYSGKTALADAIHRASPEISAILTAGRSRVIERYEKNLYTKNARGSEFALMNVDEWSNRNEVKQTIHEHKSLLEQIQIEMEEGEGDREQGTDRIYRPRGNVRTDSSDKEQANG